MSVIQKIFHKVESTEYGKRLLHGQRDRIILGAVSSFLCNLIYALYNGGLGIANRSVWFISMCAYYIILSTIRFSAILCEYKNNKRACGDMEYFVMKFAGGLLLLLSFVLTGIIYISLAENIAAKHESIMMITIATYTFCKLVMAIMRAVKQRNDHSPLLVTVRSIGYADVAVSVLTLQRSMYASFGELTGRKAHTMNVLTGAAVCLFVLLLGSSMIIKSKRKVNQ